MFAKPQSEHQWLQRMVGEWTAESECKTGPDQPSQKSESRISCRSLGGLWTLAEFEGESPEFGSWKSIMTLGYDPDAKKYVGSFVASMMSNLWLYSGSVDESGKKLVLDSEGPKFDGSGRAKYQDIIEWVNDDYWIMSSQILGDDGVWVPFMTAHHKRKK